MKTTHDMLRDLGITPRYKGYAYAVDAADICREDPAAFRCLRQRVYLPLSRRYGQGPLAVERDLRTVAQAAWQRGRPQLEALAHRPLVCCPSAGEFLALLLPPPEGRDAAAIHALLMSLGVDPRYEGYAVIVDALLLGRAGEDAFRCLLRGVYEPLGVRHGRRPRTVERSVRTAIRRARSENPRGLSRLTGCPVGEAPSARHFLETLLARVMHMENGRYDL